MTSAIRISTRSFIGSRERSSIRRAASSILSCRALMASSISVSSSSVALSRLALRYFAPRRSIARDSLFISPRSLASALASFLMLRSAIQFFALFTNPKPRLSRAFSPNVRMSALLDNAAFIVFPPKDSRKVFWKSNSSKACFRALACVSAAVAGVTSNAFAQNPASPRCGPISLLDCSRAARFCAIASS